MKSDDIPSKSSEAEHTALIYEAPEFVEQVREHLPRGWRLIELTNDTTKLALSTVEAAIGDVPAALLDSMPSLKLHQGVGLKEGAVSQSPDLPGRQLHRGLCADHC